MHQDDQQPIHHEPWCDTAHHLDPAEDCFSAPVNTHGIVSHVTKGPAGSVGGILRAYVEMATSTPSAMTAAACDEVAARFTTLSRTLRDFG